MIFSRKIIFRACLLCLLVVVLFFPGTLLCATTHHADCPPPYDVFKRPCHFNVLGWNFVIAAHGAGIRSKTNGISEKFALKIKANAYIENIQFSEYQGDILFILSVSDGDSGAGTVMLIDGVSLSPKWSVHIPGFNLSQGTIDSGFLYQAAIGFVSKIDLSNGRFIWEHKNLYDHERFSFNAFETPKLTGEYVIFKEIIQPGVKYKTPRIISVNNETGKINIK